MRNDNADCKGRTTDIKHHLERAILKAATEDPEIRMAEDKREQELVKMETGEWTCPKYIHQNVTFHLL